MKCLLSDFVTWVLVCAGWYFVHKTTLTRERRKEKREIAIKFCKDILDLQSTAIDFHTAKAFDPRKSADIGHQIEQIIHRLQKAPLRELNIPRFCYIALREKITLTNIDLSDFKSQKHDSEIILDIRTAADDLIIAIEDARERVWK